MPKDTFFTKENLWMPENIYRNCIRICKLRENSWKEGGESEYQ